jgi:hypothetical protein
MALFMFILLVFAGFAVDLTNWYLNAERVQRAADAGAHAGVVFLPADLTNATAKARAETAKNGYTTGGSGAAGSTITVTQEPNPNRLRVKVSTNVPNFFLGLIGLNSTRVSQEAVAEYVAPVPMGSPQNKLGNDPEGTDPGTQLWVNAVGPSTGKQQGERYGSKLCNSSPREFGCSSSSSTEYATDGYLYAVDVSRPVVHVRGGHQLAALGDAGDQHRVEVGAGGIDGCGVACGAGTKNQDFGVLGGGHGVRVV